MNENLNNYRNRIKQFNCLFYLFKSNVLTKEEYEKIRDRLNALFLEENKDHGRVV